MNAKLLVKLLNVIFPVLTAGMHGLVEAASETSDGGRKITKTEWEGVANAMWNELVEHGLVAIES